MNKLRAIDRIPLWKKPIPKSPVYFQGDGQRKHLLPLFWMKVIKPKEKVPPNLAMFKVHHQMTKSDIKQYLEKIYKIDVLCVRTENREKDVHAFSPHPVQRENRFKSKVDREIERIAYVTLKSEKFTYPDVMTKGKTEHSKNMEEVQQAMEDKASSYLNKNTSLGLPMWFRKQ